MALDVDDYYIDHYSTRRRQNILVLLVQPSRELRLVDVSPIHNFESTNFRIVDMSPIHDFDPNHASESPSLTCNLATWQAMGPHNVSTPAYLRATWSLDSLSYFTVRCWHRQLCTWLIYALDRIHWSILRGMWRIGWRLLGSSLGTLLTSVTWWFKTFQSAGWKTLKQLLSLWLETFDRFCISAESKWALTIYIAWT